MFKEKFDLTGKIALVTGSTRGIGKAIGDALEEYGAKVIRHNSKVCDLSEPAAIDAFFDGLEKGGSMPDILVANASVQEKIPWTEFPMDEARTEIQVNFLATLRMFQRCYPKMKAQKWGRLIVVGSVNERRPHPDMCVYAATKSAQENLVRGIARQVAGHPGEVASIDQNTVFRGQSHSRQGGASHDGAHREHPAAASGAAGRGQGRGTAARAEAMRFTIIIIIPRHSRGFFTCGQSPGILAAPSQAHRRSGICVG